MEMLKKSLLTFVLVLAGYTISTAIFISIFVRGYEFSILLLWEIIGMSAVCTLGNLIFYSKCEISKKQMRLRKIIHYIYINAAVLGGAFLFQWIDPGLLLQFLFMLVLIAAVYYGVMAFNFRKEEKTADHMNKRLQKMNAAEKELED
ncbi:MAG TPA: DUF3021 family protein [Mobilitalea sp.]|nr:DUF3021 family protein [Mobilitalea sp.]